VLGKIGEATVRLFSICIKVYCQEMREGDWGTGRKMGLTNPSSYLKSATPE